MWIATKLGSLQSTDDLLSIFCYIGKPQQTTSWKSNDSGHISNWSPSAKINNRSVIVSTAPSFVIDIFCFAYDTYQALSVIKESITLTIPYTSNHLAHHLVHRQILPSLTAVQPTSILFNLPIAIVVHESIVPGMIISV
jgi:hypothetical protein